MVQKKRRSPSTNDAHKSPPISVIRETYIVAGIVPSNITNPSSAVESLLQFECNQIQFLLTALFQHIPLSDMNDDYDSEYTDCRASFSIIALWNPFERTHSSVSIYSQTESKDKLPWITLDERIGVPIIARDKKVPRIQQQVVFYPSQHVFRHQPTRSCPDDLKECVSVLWNHGKSIWKVGHQPNKNPTFVRLTHADLFLFLVQHRIQENAALSHSSPRDGNALAVLSVQLQSAPTAAGWYQWIHALCFMEWQKSIIKFCMDQSLLLRHVATLGVPVFRLVRRPSRQSKVGGSSTIDRLLSSSQYEQVRTTLKQYQEFSFLLVDTFLGALCSILIMYSFYHFSVTTEPLRSSITMITWGVQQHYRHLNRFIEYLEHFPLGFKLNQSLLYNVGREVQRSWNIQEGMVIFVINEISKAISSTTKSSRILNAILLLFPLFLGGSGFVALAFDVLRFSSLHLSILAWFTVRIYSFELYLLSTLWNLFCGRKRNVLRHRVDTIEYDAMQLLFGTILFAMVLFLFTTIFVGHIFYTFLYLIAIGAALPFAGLYIFLRHFPWALLCYRWRRRGWFACDVYVMDDSVLDEAQCAVQLDIACLNYRSESFTEILTRSLLTRLQTMTMWFCGLIVRSLSGSASSWRELVDIIIA